jgi:hypothetical protein
MEIAELPEGLYWTEVISESGVVKRQKVIIIR